MKKLISILLLGILSLSFKNSIKITSVIAGIVMSKEIKGQNPLYLNSVLNPTDVTWDVSFLYNPTYWALRIKDTTNLNINIQNVYLKKQPSQMGGVPSNVLWVNPSDGKLNVSSVNSIPSNSDVYNAGMGLTKTGSSSPYTFAVDTNATISGTSAIMYVGKANGAINALNNSINGKVPQSRNITINGTTQDLSVDRTWSNVGIELPTQTGQSGKYLTTNGTSPSWGTISGGVTSVGLTSTDFTVSGSPVTSSGNITANLNTSGVSAGSYNNVTVNNKGIVTNGTSLVISAPSTGNTFTSGTPFQPRSGGSCFMSVQSTLGGIVGVTGLVTVAMSPTSGGTYTTVSTQRLLISVLAVTADSDSGSLPIPAGYWVRITLTGGITATYTRWDF